MCACRASNTLRTSWADNLTNVIPLRTVPHIQVAIGLYYVSVVDLVAT